MEKKTKLAVIGCGFWAQYQISAWKELQDVEIVAVCDSDHIKAENTANRHGIKKYYSDSAKLFANETIDFVDIISSIPSHAPLVHQAAAAGVAVICQKPMAEDFETCQQMVNACKEAGVSFFIHENFRWQTPIRACKQFIEEGRIGTPFKARLTFCSGFPVFDNQPALAELEQFIISDLGVHILDMSRFLFGDAARIYCQIQKINPSIKGEDVANMLLTMKNGVNCFIEISYASKLEQETFPQTLILIEGTEGSVRLDYNHAITLTRKGAASKKTQADPPDYPWADPDYALIHSSVVECNKNILGALKGQHAGETTAEDNLKTMELVFLAYESADKNQVINTSL